MRQRTIIVLGTLLLSVAALAACVGQSAPPGATLPATSTPAPAADFTLTDQDGRPFRLSDQRGNVVLLFFGYTNCPDVCPTTLAIWKQVQRALSPDADRVRFVFITVDPERDTAERIKDHLAIFSPDFIGLSGTPDELSAIYQAYGIYHEKGEAQGSAAGYLVTHRPRHFSSIRTGGGVGCSRTEPTPKPSRVTSGRRYSDLRFIFTKGNLS